MPADGRRNLYDVLGVPRDADADAIRTAYRGAARKYHPDVNPGDKAAEDRFKEISEAYSVLSDEEKRKSYDEFGDVSLEAGFDPAEARRAREAFAGGMPFGYGGVEFDLGGEGGLDDLFGQLFGGRARGGPQARRPRRGRDLEATLELGFLEAARGGEKRVVLQVPDAEGALRPRTVTVRIPAGVADGGRIRLAGQGFPGRAGGPPGDLFARIRVRPHPVFRREGRDLHLEAPLTVAEAIRGAKVEVPTLSGRATVTVPPGTDGGQRLRLRGKGVPDPSGGPPGDLYVTLQIRVPRQAKPELLRALEEAGDDGAALRQSLFDDSG